MLKKFLIMEVCDFIYSKLKFPRPKDSILEQAKVVAHRGDHKNFKENTIESFQSCLDANLFGIELDVRWTKDLVPIILHDIDAKRVFAREDIIPHQINFEELRKQVPEIPTLEEVLEKFANKIHLFIEIKKPAIGLSKKQQMAIILNKALKNLTPSKDFHLLSILPENFQLLEGFPKSCMAMVSIDDHKKDFQFAIDNNLGQFFGHYILTTKSIINAMKEKNMKLATGYIMNKNLAYRQINRGSDWLFSNNAIELQRQLSL